MANVAQENQGFQHRVRHAGTVWAHYEPTETAEISDGRIQ